MAVAFVQSAFNREAGSSGTVAATFGGAVASGGMVCGAVGQDQAGGVVSSIADDKLNSYTVVENKTDSLNGVHFVTFYALNITNAPTIVTVTFTAAITNRTIVIHEVSGVATAAALDQHLSAETNTSTADATKTGDVTTTTDGQYIFGVAMNSEEIFGDLSIGTGFTSRTVNNGALYDMATEDLIQSTAGLLTGGALFTCSAIRRCQIAVMTFKASAGVSSGDFGGPAIPFFRVRLRQY